MSGSFWASTGTQSDVDNMSATLLEYDFVQDKWKNLKAGENITEEILNCLLECFDKAGSMAFCDVKQKIYVLTNERLHCVDVKDEDGEIIMDKITELHAFVLEEGVTLRDRSLITNKGNLYCIGGAKVFSRTEIECCDSLFLYDEEAGKWTAKPSMGSKRTMLTAVSAGMAMK